MVLGAAGFDLMPGLKVEKLSESALFRSVEILFHQCECDTRAASQFVGEQHGGCIWLERALSRSGRLSVNVANLAQ
jgi:hypothetical protein